MCVAGSPWLWPRVQGALQLWAGEACERVPPMRLRATTPSWRTDSLGQRTTGERRSYALSVVQEWGSTAYGRNPQACVPTTHIKRQAAQGCTVAPTSPHSRPPVSACSLRCGTPPRRRPAPGAPRTGRP